MDAQRLLNKLEFEAELELDHKEQERKRQAANPVVTLDLRLHQALSMMNHLRKKKNDIYVELEMRHRLKAEHASYMRAVMELREADLTAEERKTRAEETRQGQIAFSRIVEENHPDWRLQPNYNDEYYRQQSALRKGKS